MNRRAFLASLSVLAPGASVRRAVNYLWSRQSRDGGWHSETYGLLRSGQSLTPLIVNALLDAGADPSDPRLQRAMKFIQHQISLEGAVGLTGDDYPCYATALTLRALVRTQTPGTAKLIQWLKTQQMGPANGWQPKHEAFGAWGIGGAIRSAPDPGHIDISMTRHVLEALAEAGVRSSEPAMQQARVFVGRCQNPDGGFYFSTVETGANKAGETPTGYLSYGTTTADGLLCQISTGDTNTIPALRWLEANDTADLPAGFTTPARHRYAEGLRYYYADGVTRALRAAGRLRAATYRPVLERLQRPDGSWSNPEVLVKEDDPLIATPLALSTLSV